MNRCRCSELGFLDYNFSNVILKQSIISEDERKKYYRHICLHCATCAVSQKNSRKYMIDVTDSSLPVSYIILEAKIIYDILDERKIKVTSKEMYYIISIIIYMFSDKNRDLFTKYRFLEIREEIVSIVLKNIIGNEIRHLKNLKERLIGKSENYILIDIQKLKNLEFDYGNFKLYGPTLIFANSII